MSSMIPGLNLAASQCGFYLGPFKPQYTSYSINFCQILSSNFGALQFGDTNKTVGTWGRSC